MGRSSRGFRRNGSVVGTSLLHETLGLINDGFPVRSTLEIQVLCLAHYRGINVHGNGVAGGAVMPRRAKLGQIQGGLQRASQIRQILQYFFTFYALKISLFRVFTLSD